jgi:hypothetical protein
MPTRQKITDVLVECDNILADIDEIVQRGVEARDVEIVQYLRHRIDLRKNIMWLADNITTVAEEKND